MKTTKTTNTKPEVKPTKPEVKSIDLIIQELFQDPIEFEFEHHHDMVPMVRKCPYK